MPPVALPAATAPLLLRPADKGDMRRCELASKLEALNRPLVGVRMFGESMMKVGSRSWCLRRNRNDLQRVCALGCPARMLGDAFWQPTHARGPSLKGRGCDASRSRYKGGHKRFEIKTLGLKRHPAAEECRLRLAKNACCDFGCCEPQVYKCALVSSSPRAHTLQCDAILGEIPSGARLDPLLVPHGPRKVHQRG